MKVVDCLWEIKNIGKRTVEISIESNDEITGEQLKAIYNNYDYVVIKVPINKIDVNTILADLGFMMIECQYKISKLYKDFNPDDRLIKRLIPKFNFKKVGSKEDFKILTDKMTLGMFTTDRIALDPHFGFEDSYRRYKNWMTTEFENQTSEFLLTCLNENPIGYCMYKKENDTVDGLLGGIFEEYQDSGYGLITPLQLFLYAYKDDEFCFKKMITSISSNNAPVVELYNYLNFRLTDTTYVFVKHLD